MLPEIKSVGHTTASKPRPHIIYKFEVERDGIVDTVYKRYSEFVVLHATLGISDFELPPKRLLVTTFIPSAWVDDALIAERTIGLELYLTKLLEVPHYRESGAVKEFLSLSTPTSLPEFELEDAVPSTFSRKTAETLSTAAATFPGRTAFPPEKLDYSKFDILFFAFAIPSTSFTLTWDSATQDLLKRLVANAKKSGKGTKIVLSIGGWTGSGPFHQITGSASSRSKFVSTLFATVSKFGLDGIDIDWEYPNAAGAGNPYGSADSANLLRSSKIISAAVTDLPWLGSNGRPLTDVSEYASQLTYVNLMNYDINGPWSSSPGPNAPYGNLCGNSSQPALSAQSALKQWTAAKFPASKLLLGLPLYGYVYNSSKTTLANFVLPGSDAELDAEITDISKPAPADQTNSAIRGANKKPVDHSESGLAALQSQSLVASGALVKNSDGKYYAGPGFTRAWDVCSKTPFLYSTAQKTVVSYDDTSSLDAKTGFAKSNGMAGCFTWSLDQDDGVTLHNAIRKALGK
ncbi:glycoside hydrolase family 18 protein [Mycena olivaceomarginata]|nr:glycoside hydrolase family 18 protein [Mycena olivaceomarginata]